MQKDLDSTHIITNNTGRKLRDSIDVISDALSTLSITKSGNVDPTNFKHIQSIVRLGRAKDYFQIGDQIHMTWSPDGETEYDMPWDIVDFGPATDPDGIVHENAMWLQSHYVLPAVQFDGCEAFYVAPDAMPAGTYHFSFGAQMSNTAPENTPFMFTLTKAVPAGGMLILGSASGDTIAVSGAVSTWRVRVYANGAQTDPDEVVEISQGDDGTDLGKLVPATPYGKEGLNDIYRLRGYNRWSQSAMRQWLNSDKPIGEWWKQQNPYDRKPDQLTTFRGFEAGLPAEFLTIVKPVKVVTALNLSTDKSFGDSETTIDRFFQAAMEQEYIEPRWHGEGTAFKYWVDRLGTEHKTGTSNKRAEHIRYSISNNATASSVRLRSAYRSNSTYAGAVSATGFATYTYAYGANGIAPCCVIY